MINNKKLVVKTGSGVQPFKDYFKQYLQRVITYFIKLFKIYIYFSKRIKELG